jgi:hypothetical protein
MKTRQLVTVCALLATLMVSGMSATAGEKLNGISTALSNTTLSGYVDSSIIWQVQPTSVTPHHESRGWWWNFSRWLGFH